MLSKDQWLAEQEANEKVLNYYSCDKCEVYWEEYSSCETECRCPKCNVHYTPYLSEGLE